MWTTIYVASGSEWASEIEENYVLRVLLLK